MLSSLHGEAVRFDDERFAVVLGHDVENGIPEIRLRNSSAFPLLDRSRVKFGIIILSSIPIYTEDSFGLVVQLPAAIMWGFSYMP